MSSLACVVDECERDDWIVGVPGVCDNVTGLCSCPEGFGGRDVWQNFESCHIPDLGFAIVNICYLVVTAATTASTLGIVIYLLCKWRMYPSLRLSGRASGIGRTFTKMSRSGSISEDGQSTDFNHTRSESTLKRDRHIGSRRFWIIKVLAMFTVYPALALPYGICAVLGIFRYDIPWAIDIPLGLSVSFLYAGFWIVLYIYFRTLPDLSMIGRLLDVNSVFIRNPSLLRRLVVFHATIEFVVVTVVLGILPPLFPDNATRFFLSQVFSYIAIVVVIDFLVVLLAVGYTLRKLYKKASDLLNEGENASLLDQRKVDRAVSNITCMMVGMTIIILIAIVPLGAMIAQNGKRYYFVFFFIVSCTAFSGSLFASFLFARELISNKAPSLRDPIRKPSEKKPTVIHNI